MFSHYRYIGGYTLQFAQEGFHTVWYDDVPEEERIHVLEGDILGIQWVVGQAVPYTKIQCDETHPSLYFTSPSAFPNVGAELRIKKIQPREVCRIFRAQAIIGVVRYNSENNNIMDLHITQKKILIC